MFDTKNLKINHLIAAILTLILGTLMHFVYQWTNENLIAGFFAPVSESTWEHLKLLFYPMLFFSILEYYTIGHRYNNYIFATAIGLLAGMVTIITLFYTYTGILGQNFLPLDILCFILGVAMAYYVSYAILTEQILVSHSGRSFQGLIIILLLVIAFSIFTFYQPSAPLFEIPTMSNERSSARSNP